MKKIIALLLCFISVFSLCGCRHSVNTTSKVVDAIVYDTLVDNWGYEYLFVAFESTKTKLQVPRDADIVEYYKDHLGETFPCYLITHEYDNGDVEQNLVYNESLCNIPEGEPIHPEGYTFPEGVE